MAVNMNDVRDNDMTFEISMIALVRNYNTHDKICNVITCNNKILIITILTIII